MPKRHQKDGSVAKDKDVSIADRYYGMFKVKKWPEDLDEFLTKQITKNPLKKRRQCKR